VESGLITPEADKRLSVIIVNWNTSDLLRTCLLSMGGLHKHPDYEVLVVDNHSSDGSVEMVRSEFPGVTLLAQDANLGFSRGNNVGLRNATGKYLLLLNSDTEVVDNALQAMCDYMDANPDIGVLGPKLLNPDGTLQLSCRRFPSYRTALFHRYSLLTRLFPRNKYSADYLMTGSGHDKVMDVDWVSGACLLARREAVVQVGLLDEDFFMYAEDVDWCYRMKRAGWRIVYYPEAQVVHHIGKSSRKMPVKTTYERHRSMWHFYRKHYSSGIVLVDVATWLGIGLRCTLMISRNAMKGRGRSTK
jgi:GT2 family glycosyltransferase